MPETSVFNDPNSKGFPKTSLSLLIAGCLGFVALIVFEPAIRRYDILDRESASWVCFAAIALSAFLGFCSLRSSMGKLVALLGSVIVVGLLAWVSYSDPGESSIRELRIHKAPQEGNASDIELP